jgi:O-antigen/teichoic acid export membrane protein
MFLTHLVNQFGNQFQGLLIGRFYNPSIMGLYSKAQATEKLSSQSISQVLTQVTYPLYAEAQDDKKALGNMIKRITMVLSFMTFPLMFILLLCAKPIFVLLYSDRWVGSVPYFQVLCIAGLAFCLQSVNYQSISAIGKSKTLFYWTMVKRLAGIIFVVLGLLLYGMKGLLIGMVLNTWFSYFVNIGLVSKHIGYKWTTQLLDILPVLIASTVAALASYYISAFFDLQLYVDGLVKLFIYLTIYIICALVFRLEAFTYTKTIIAPMLNRLKKRL